MQADSCDDSRMSPAVAQSYSGGLGGSLGGLLNKATGKGNNPSPGQGGFMGAGGPPSSNSTSQWDTYRTQAPSPLKQTRPYDLIFDNDRTSPAAQRHPNQDPFFPPTTPSPTSPTSLTNYTREFPPPLDPRQYTVLREVGDGSFGTVWLADWHSPLQLPPGTLPPGPSSRAEYKGKQLVAVKRMKKAFDGGWDECMKLKELKSLRQIPMHPNIIPLYDAFLLPSTRELYFVFECMEGNLYQLTKSRKGRPLAAGLTASIFYQILAGLDHVHRSGYFHRDMKPENLLITTTGLADYPASSLYALPGTPTEKDVVVVVKLADFGLAREIHSRPPYTEYVSTRWYRAPEVLLRSRDYSIPVDMWALGTIMVEAITLKPLFPGESEVDQIHKICQLLGDPSAEYGLDDRGRTRGGGPWTRGAKMAKDVGFAFPKMTPRSWTAFFDMNTVSIELIDCIADLLRYEPKARPSAQACLASAYFRDIAPRFAPRPARYDRPVPTSPASPRFPTPSHPSHLPPPNNQSQYRSPPSDASASTRNLSLDSSYPVHLQRPTQQQQSQQQYDSPMHAYPADATPSFPLPSTWQPQPQQPQRQQQHGDPNWGPSASLQPVPEGSRPIPAFGHHEGRRGSLGAPSIAASTFYDGSIFEGIAPTRQEAIMSFPASYGSYDPAPPLEYPNSPTMMDRDDSQDSTPALVLGPGGRAQQPQQQQPAAIPPPPPPQQPPPQASTSKPSRSGWNFFNSSSSNNNSSAPPLQPPSNPLKRTPSHGASAHASPDPDQSSPPKAPLDPKKAKKEAEKAAKEAERLKRDNAQMASRERARAVMKKKSQIGEGGDPLHNFSNHGSRIQPAVDSKGKGREQPQAGGGKQRTSTPQIVEDTSKLQVSKDSRFKMRRRDDDDDVHSVSSNETGHSSQRGRPFSISSQQTSASEPDPSQRRQQQQAHPSWPEPDPSQRMAPMSSSRTYGPAAPSTGHSSLDLATRMQGLATTSHSDHPSSRGHRSSSPASNSNSERFSPYPSYRTSGQTLPPISSFDGPQQQQQQQQQHQHARQASHASIQSYQSAPHVLPSHYLPHGDGSGPTLLAPPFMLATTEATPPGVSSQFVPYDPNQPQG
ncbi:hypothetical protein RQP46_003708 [Phenoliferia psychrophenolica]